MYWPRSWPFPAMRMTSPFAASPMAIAIAAARSGSTIDVRTVPRRHRQRPGQHLAQDRQRILGSRVVAGEDRGIGQLCGDRAHQRPLGGVPVAAAAEHDPQASLGHRAQRVQHGLDRSWLVRVVDQDGEVVLDCRLAPAGQARQDRRPRRSRPCRGRLRSRPARRSAASAFATLNGPGSVIDASASTPPGPMTWKVEPSAPHRTSTARQSASGRPLAENVVTGTAARFARRRPRGSSTLTTADLRVPRREQARPWRRSKHPCRGESPGDPATGW